MLLGHNESCILKYIDKNMDGGFLELLKKELKQFIITLTEEQQALQQTSSEIALYKEEKNYLEKYLLSDEFNSELTFVEKKPNTRFEDAYIERSMKATEEVIAIETASFLQQPLNYLKDHKEEFIYLESKWVELIGVDAISLEVDDVFGNYDAMVGLKMQKKLEKTIKGYLDKELSNSNMSYDLLFNPDDGLWDLNVTLDDMNHFEESISIGDAFTLIYRFLFKLAEALETEEGSK